AIHAGFRVPLPQWCAVHRVIFDPTGNEPANRSIIKRDVLSLDKENIRIMATKSPQIIARSADDRCEQAETRYVGRRHRFSIILSCFCCKYVDEFSLRFRQKCVMSVATF